MQTYFVIGKYNSEAIKDMSANRTEKSISLIKELGGEVRNMYALLGGFDFVMIVDLPSNDVAMKVSLGLSVLTGIAFTTYPAVSVDDFDKIIGNSIV